MTTNFIDLTDEELDKLAAEMIMGGVSTVFNDPGLFISVNGIMIKWNPTHPESNQARQNLKKALLKKCSKISIEVTYYSNHTTIAVGHDDEPEIIFWYSFDDVDGKEENRYFVITALEAWEKING